MTLFKGLSASLLSVSNAIIYFLCYETLKKTLKEHQISHIDVVNIFIASTIAKSILRYIVAIASSITYPLIVVRTIMHDSR